METGLKRDRTLAILHKNLALTALVEGHPDEAIQHLETALPLYAPVDSAGKGEATYWLAAAQAAAGRAEKACLTLRKFEVLEPPLLSPYANDAARLAQQNRCTPWP